MNVIAISDIHGEPKKIDEIADIFTGIDLILLSGDITHFGGRKEAINIIDKIRKYNTNILAVPGNCDYPEVNQYLIEEGISLDCRHKVIDNIYFTGIGGSLPCPGRTPVEYTEEEYNELLKEIIPDLNKGQLLVLLIHQPPFGTTADMLPDGLHVGSNAIRKFIEEYQPVLCLCGHIHEGIGMDKIGNSRIVNPGPLRFGRYVWATIDNNKEIEVNIKRV